MRWKIKSAIPKPVVGDVREQVKFAWFPTRIDDHMVWLERYISVQTYSPVWHAAEWVETGRMPAMFYY